MQRILTSVLLALALPWAFAQTPAPDPGRDAYAREDYAAALSAWQPRAERGDAWAQFGLGVMYERGQGVDMDPTTAARWYRSAAEQGFAPAQFNLGSAYESGRGVPKDLALAGHWWRKAAEQGFARAQYNLGALYFYGWGVARDQQQAARWFQLAAEQGDQTAARILASMQKPTPVSGADAPTAKPAGALATASAQPAAEGEQSSAPGDDGVRGPEWIASLPSRQYILQVFANWTRESVERFARERELPGPRAILRTRLDGKDWYVLVAGVYAELGAAREALRGLPRESQAMGAWVRTVASLQEVLGRGEVAASVPQSLDDISEMQVVSVPEPATRVEKPDRPPESPGLSTEAAVVETPSVPPAGERGAAWILAQDPSAYTVQVFGTDSESAAREFIRSQGLTGQAAWFRFVRNGSPWYSVVLGVYSDSAQANRALAALPAQLRRWSPWVRRLGSVQALIRSGSEPPAAGSGSAPAAAAAPPPAPARPVRAADPADLARGQAAFNRGRYAEARRRWQPLADAGQVEAQYNLGFLLESGWGGNKDLAGAARWYARAAVQGHARARYNLGVMFIDGRGAPLDLARGVQLVRMAAEADYPVAAEYLAGCYRSGTCGLERDAQQAARWQERSERQTLVR